MMKRKKFSHGVVTALLRAQFAVNSSTKLWNATANRKNRARLYHSLFTGTTKFTLDWAHTEGDTYHDGNKFNRFLLLSTHTLDKEHNYLHLLTREMNSISNEILGLSFEPFKNLHKLHAHDKLNDQFPLNGFWEVWTLIPLLQPSQTAVPRTKPVLLRS